MLSPKLEELFLTNEYKESEEGLMDFFLQLSAYTYEYKFFYLELPSILNNDSEMKELYREWAQSMMERLDNIFIHLIETNIMRPEISPTARTLLVQNCWTLLQTGITYVNMLDSNTPTREACNIMIQRLYALLHPYFSEDSHSKMMGLFENNNLAFRSYA
jgi:hypothetical protein